MTRRTVLPAVVLLALALALAAALQVPRPADGLPAVALEATLVWRVEVAAAVFAALYGAIVVVRLAVDGTTLSRIGAGGIDIPQLGRFDDQPTAARAIEDVATSVAALGETVCRIEARVARVEHAHDLVLRSRDEET